MPSSWRRPPPILSARWLAGIGDDLLTTIMLAATRPVLVCPAMNCEMWANPVVQENLARLEARGLEVMSRRRATWPAAPSGLGRLPEPET